MLGNPHKPKTLTPSVLSAVRAQVADALTSTGERGHDHICVTLPISLPEPISLLRRAFDAKTEPGSGRRPVSFDPEAGRRTPHFEPNTTSPPLFYWEIPSRHEALLGFGSRRTLRSTGESRFSEIAHAANTLSARMLQVNLSEAEEEEIPLLTGGYSFGPFNVSPAWREFGAARFDVPILMLCKRPDGDLLRYVSAKEERDPKAVADGLASAWAALMREVATDAERLVHADPRSPGDPDRRSEDSTVVSGWTKESSGETEPAKRAWMDAVGTAVERIRRGEFEKVVLAREVVLPLGEDADLTGMIQALRGRFPDCYHFAMRLESGACFLGASPERLVQLDSGHVEIDALAGSARRGSDPESDEALSAALLNSRKDRMEHRYVVHQIVQSLDGVARDVRYPSTPGMRKLANVQHLHTPVSARLLEGADLQTLMGRLHPTPAVGGYPAAKAVPHIHELENLDRGWYAGTIGWFAPQGSGEFAVSIRSGYAAQGVLRLYAGCGIVEHSDPQQEWEETRMKIEPLLEAARQTLVEDA